MVSLAFVPPAHAKRGKKKPAPKPAARIVRGPYLQQTGTSSTIVVWQTDRPAGGRVQFGRHSVREQARGAPSKSTFQAVTLKGLHADTRYKYRVSLGRSNSSTASLRTAPTEPGPFSFGVIGDYGTGKGAEYKNAQLMSQEPISFVITAGDNVYGNGYDSEYDRGLFAPFGGLMRRLAFWPSLGNHDYGNGEDVQRNDASAYFKNFVLPQDPAQERYYTFAYGDAQFWALNTEVGDYAPGSQQYEWLKSSLDNSNACWKIAYFHRPPYSSRASTTTLRTTLVPLFERSGVELVISGHQHNYERTVPLLAGTQDDAKGITYVVTGGGGAALQQFPDDFPPSSTAYRGTFYEHLLASVDGAKMTLKSIGTSGHTQDEAHLECGRANGSLPTGGTSPPS